MGVTFDASAINESDGSADPSFSYTVTGANPALFVGVGTGKENSLTINGITYGGNALTLVRREANSDNAIVEIWKLAAPPTGANTLIVDLVNSPAPDPFIVIPISFAGADQTDPVGAQNGTIGSGSTATIGVTSATDEFVFDVYAEVEGPDANVGAGQTERQRNTGSGPEPQVATSTEPGAAGTVTMSWAIQTDWAIVAVSVKAAAAGATYFLGFKVQGEGDLALTEVGTHPLRVRKGGVTFGLELVPTTDPNASRIRIKTGTGVMSIRKFTA